MRKLSLAAFLCGIVLAGCDSGPTHSLAGNWVGTFQGNPTRQSFNADKSYFAVTDTKMFRITQRGTWEASESQLVITNGDVDVEGTSPSTNLQVQSDMTRNKGKKSFAALQWDGLDRVAIYNTSGQPPMQLVRVSPPAGQATGKSADKATPK